jgi:hypothetical protein
MPIAPGSLTNHGLCCTHHASHFCAPGWPRIVASRPKGAPVLSEQTLPTIRLSIMELRRPQVFAEEATEQTFRHCGTASIESVEHVESLRLAGSTASDVDRPLGTAPLNQRNVQPHPIDAFIVPLAASALSVKTLLRSTLELLVTVLDGIFYPCRTPMMRLRRHGPNPARSPMAQRGWPGFSAVELPPPHRSSLLQARP